MPSRARVSGTGGLGGCLVFVRLKLAGIRSPQRSLFFWLSFDILLLFVDFVSCLTVSSSAIGLTVCCALLFTFSIVGLLVDGCISAPLALMAPFAVP